MDSVDQLPRNELEDGGVADLDHLRLPGIPVIRRREGWGVGGGGVRFLGRRAIEKRQGSRPGSIRDIGELCLDEGWGGGRRRLGVEIERWRGDRSAAIAPSHR